MISKNPKETEKIAKIFLEKILNSKNHKDAKGALVVALSGDLGAGKTVLTQAIAKHLGIKSKVGSPTFVIMKKYSLPLTRGIKGVEFKYKFIFHLDAYRLKNEKELLYLGWEEIINNKENIVFIEWPENVSKIIPADAKFIYISHHKNDYRELKLR